VHDEVHDEEEATPCAAPGGATAPAPAALPKAKKRPMYSDGSRPMYALLAQRAARPRPAKGTWR